MQDTNNKLFSLIEEITSHLINIDSSFEGSIKKLLLLKNRLIEENFHLAILGQFKRGKSSFINALIGENLMPISVVPLTSIPTFIKYSDSKKVKLFYYNNKEPQEYYVENSEEINALLTKYVTEYGNPKNKLEIDFVEVFFPAHILKGGLILIDTPGIGSTFQHNTQTTINFLPQCDAAFFIVSADPPITEVEIEFLKSIKSKISPLFFILNKIDYLSPDELETSLLFLKNTLKEKLELDFEIYPISAKLAIDSYNPQSQTSWDMSGMSMLKKDIIEFITNEKYIALENSIIQKVKISLERIIDNMTLMIETVSMPYLELEEKLAKLGKKIEEAKFQKILIKDMLSGEKKRMTEYLEELAEKIRIESFKYLLDVVKKNIDTKSYKLDNEEEIDNSLANIIPVYFEQKTKEITDIFNKYVINSFKPHIQKLKDLSNFISAAANEIFGTKSSFSEDIYELEIKRKPYWITYKWDTSIGAIPKSFLHAILPKKLKEKFKIKKINEQLEYLIVRNVENIRWSLLQNISDTFIHFEDLIEERFDDAIKSTYGIVAAMAQRHKQTGDIISTEIEKLKNQKEIFLNFKDELNKINI